MRAESRGTRRLKENERPDQRSPSILPTNLVSLRLIGSDPVSPPEFLPPTGNKQMTMYILGEISSLFEKVRRQKCQNPAPNFCGEQAGHTNANAASGEARRAREECHALWRVTQLQAATADAHPRSHAAPVFSVKEIGTSRGQFKSQMDRRALWH